MMREEVDDPYQILGLARGADARMVKRAYRALSLTWHPDRHLDKPEAVQENAERRFKQIHAAYLAIGQILLEAPAVRAAALEPQRAAEVTEAIRSAVASGANRVLARQSHYAYRRIVEVAERLLIQATQGQEALFAAGLEPALRMEMDAVGMDPPMRPGVVRLLLLVASELPWRGKGPEPEAWLTLLAPLERALRDARIE